MDPLINGLYGIPVIGIVFQFVGYLVAIIPPTSPFILAGAVPIALGALCGIMNERSGVVNIAIEGMMLSAAFVGWFVASAVGQPTEASGLIFGITPGLVLGVAAAVVAAMLVSAIHAWLSISVKADQIISGTIINIAALGFTGYLNQLISKGSPPSSGALSPFAPPQAVIDIPVVGWILDMFLAQGPIAMSVIVLVIGLQVWLFRTRWGLRTRAVGEHPRAAETVGIDVVRLRYRNVILGGVFAGLAGAYLSLEVAGSFQNNMTIGRGFIALAAMIFGRWTPIGAFGAALLFSLAEVLQRAVTFTPPTGELGAIMTGIPSQFYQMLPYLLTIVVLVGVVGRSVAPAADGQPYERESAT
jgi:ABC-type uncharacterized transport system permease subunit